MKILANLIGCCINPRIMKNVSTHKGACSSSVNLSQGACSQIFNWFNIVEHLQDGHSPPEDKVYL